MKSFRPQFVIFSLTTLLLVKPAFAEESTCSERLRSSVYVVNGLETLSLVLFVMVPASSHISIRQLRDAERLESATILTQRNYSIKKLRQAEFVISEYYDKLVKRYPDMRLGKNEVISLLHDLNLNGIKNGRCKTIDWFLPGNIAESHTLTNDFFPDAKAQKYLDYARKQKEQKLYRQTQGASQKQMEASHAKQIRDEKNKDYNSMYYQEISNDEETQRLLYDVYN